MRFADVILRQGHLSEEGLIQVVMTGDRPLHLDRCARCADRAVELARWLDEVRRRAVGEVDDAFTAERLGAQHAQILRRLEQVDEPARVIAFPSTVGATHRAPGLRRVAPAWVGIAAAAGLVLGLIGGQVSARLFISPPAATATASTKSAASPIDNTADQVPASDKSFLEYDFDRYTPEPLQGIDDFTPRLVPSGYTVASRR